MASLTVDRRVVVLVAWFLLSGCRHAAPLIVAAPRVVDYVLIPATTTGTAVLCIEVTALMRLERSYIGADILCGETVQQFRDRVRDTRRAN